MPYLSAQVVMAPGGGGVYSFAFFDDGQPVGPTGVRLPFGVPEPASLGLAVLATIATLARRSR